jgi:F420-0:gamma-glutamyl ligase-like protein
MKSHIVAIAVATFVLGGLVGHIVTLPSPVAATTPVAQISSFELTTKAGHLPLQSANAI